MRIRKMNEMNTPKYGIIRTDYKPKEKFDKRVYLLLLDDWEGLYVDGKLITQEHHIEGMDLLKFAEKYGFTYSNVYCDYANETENDDYFERNHGFPPDINDLPSYNIWLKKNHPDRYEANKFNF